MIDYRKILLAVVNAELEYEGMYYEPSGLSDEEMAAYLGIVLEADVNEPTEAHIRQKLEKLGAAA